MASVPLEAPFQKEIDALLFAINEKAIANFHRYLVVMEGTKSWCLHQTEKLMGGASHGDGQGAITKPNLSSIFFSSDENLTDATRPNLLQTMLGTECDQVVWDGHTNLEANGLCAAAGLIKAGGLFALLLPSVRELDSNNPYLHHLYKSFSTNQVIMIRQNERPASLLSSISEASLGEFDTTLPNKDQDAAIESIRRVVKGHRRRPLIIEADRGRGKSTALALAAIELVKDDAQTQVVVTAPAKQNTCIFFRYVSDNLSTEAQARVRFVAPDELVASKLACTLLLIDEAAAIPSPMLEALVSKYSRVVLASTIQGYEGSGRGFQIRFKHKLNTLCPGWTEIKLKTPVRWAENDPLETWCFETFALNAAIKKVRKEDLDFGQLKTEWHDHHNLKNEGPSHAELFALLALAHYQTAPSDFQFILEHPELRVAIVHDSSVEDCPLLGIAVVIREGNIHDAEQHNNIIAGRRRPPGNLVPQALAVHSCIPDIMALNSWRIMRIVVHPELTRCGIGSLLLSFIQQEAQKPGQNQAPAVDFLSTSFGVQPDVFAFWITNRFNLNWLGYHKDKSSGAHSVILSQAYTPNGASILQRISKQFREHFLHLLPSTFANLSTELVLSLLSQIRWWERDKNALEAVVDASNFSVGVENFAFGYRSIEDSIRQLAECYINAIDNGTALEVLDTEQHELVIAKLLQFKSWDDLAKRGLVIGKKQGLRELRLCFQSLLAKPTSGD